MSNDEPTPKWRNFAAWSGVGALFYLLVLCGASWFLEGTIAMPRSKEVAASLGLGLVFAMAVIGFSSRKQPVSLRTLRNFAIHNLVAIIVFLLAMWGFRRFDGAGEMGASEWAAAILGAALLTVASLGTLAVASVHTGADLVDDEEAAEDMRERGRLILYSFIWVAAYGLLLIGLSLAGPGGVLPLAATLAGALVLIAILSVLGIATWRLSDELARALSLEAGNIAFYLIWAVGSGWAILAHLGIVAAPAPLDLLTMFTIFLFAASIIAAGRRKLLTR